MASRSVFRFFTSSRRGPTLMSLGAITFLALCLFALHLPPMQPPPAIASAQLGRHPTPPTRDPQQQPVGLAGINHYMGSDFLQTLLDLTRREKARKAAGLPMENAAAKRPSFRDDPPRMVEDLPREHIPRAAPLVPPSDDDDDGRSTKPRVTGRRLVVVGDVHGHLQTLKALLKKIRFDNRQGDHLVLAGDIVTKGPDSRGVVKLAMELGASAVRGNQDDKVLAVAREIRRLAAANGEGDDVEPGDDEYTGEGEEDEEDDDERFDVETRRRIRLRKVARSLSRSQLNWLRNLPLILRIGPIPDARAAPWNASTIAVVHGGLVPGVPLEKQDPWAVMNMRSLVYPREPLTWEPTVWSWMKDGKNDEEKEEEDEETSEDEVVVDTAIAIPVDGREGEPWSHAWNRHQNNLPENYPRTVVIYGHDARAGLQVDPVVDISPYRPRHKKGHNKHGSKDKKHKKQKKKSPKSHSPLRANDNDREEHLADDSTTLSANKHNNNNSPPTKQTGLRYAFGLDSGCGHDQKLTALILEATPEGGVSHRIEQVDCVKDGKKKGRGRSGSRGGGSLWGGDLK